MSNNSSNISNSLNRNIYDKNNKKNNNFNMDRRLSR